jgi:predicted O-methyltransferase YrrM
MPMTVLSHFVLWLLGLARPQSQTNERERGCLARHASGKTRVAEIGLWHGVTTCRLRSVMKPDGVLLAIDPFPPGRLGFSVQRVIAYREVSKIHNGTVQWMRQSGADAGRMYAAGKRPPVEFVFIDGDHTYEGLRGDWEAWAGLVAPDGLIGIHDSRSSPQRQIDSAGSVRFTRDVVLCDPRFEFIDAVDTLTVVRRRISAA